jgi:hypothetical protein
MRPALVVVLAPRLDRPARFGQTAEPVFIEALVPQAPIETLHVSVLHRSSGLDIVPPDSLFVRPLVQGPAGELRSVVGADLSSQPAFHLQIIQYPRYPPTTQRGVHFDGQGFARKVVYDGGRNGFMSYPDYAALDPIFYLHHANIDRMWAGWNQRYSNPKVDGWVKGPTVPADRKFVMPMPDGKHWQYTPGDVNSLSQLDYGYDNLPSPPAVNLLAQRLTRLGAVAAASKVQEGATVIPGKNVELVGANQQPLPIKGSGVSTTVRLDPGVQRKVTASLAAASETAVPDRVLLNLENVRGVEDATILDVYINLPEGAKPSDHPELFAGSVSLFGLRKASAKDEKHAGEGLNLVLDITDIVDALHLKNGLSTDSLTVRIVPANEVRDEDQITVGRVSIYRHGR